MTDFDSPSTADGFDVEAELRVLAGGLAISEPDMRTVEAVMARLDDEPEPVPARPAQRAGEVLESFRRILRNRWRLVGVAVAALLALLLAVTPAGAKVREWLGFGAVVVEQQQSAPAGDPAAPAITAPIPAITALIPPNAAPDGHDMTLEQAVAGSTFPVRVPAALGDPDRVTVSDDSRVVSMEWFSSAGGTVRLDQIDGSLSPYFVKKFYQDVEFTTVDGAEALWLNRPHPIVMLDPDGTERAESARLSGPSLVWQDAAVTLRLEGVSDRSAAVTIAESMPG